MTGPEFDTRPEGSAVIVAILVAAVALLVGGGVWLGWLLWGVQ